MGTSINKESSAVSRLGCSSLASPAPQAWPHQVSRVAATGLAFAAFMVSALVLALGVFPLVRVFPGTMDTKRRRIRRLIHHSFALFLRACATLGLMRPPKIIGLGSLGITGPCILVANHPTLIDAVLIGSLVRDFNCVVKHTLRDHFFLGGPIRAAGYVTNEAPAEVIRLCSAGFQQGQPLVIFPEGSRSMAGSPRPFSRGAAQLALRTGAPVIPVVITCDPPTLMKHQRWYEVPDRPFQLTVRFYPPLVCLKCDSLSDPLPIKARRFTRQIEEFFKRELQPAAVPEAFD